MEVFDSLFQACVQQFPVHMYGVRSRSRTVIHVVGVGVFLYV